MNSTLGNNGSFGALLGKRCDVPGDFNANALDVFLNLDTTIHDSVKLNFYFRDIADENDSRDGIIMIIEKEIYDMKTSVNG